MSLAEEMPILNVNIQGDYPTEQLKKYAEIIEDRIEKLDEIKEVDILGAQDEEIEVGAISDPIVYHSTMTLIVDGYVQTFSNLDDQLDQIGIEVQVAMAEDIDINNLIKILICHRWTFPIPEMAPVRLESLDTTIQCFIASDS